MTSPFTVQTEELGDGLRVLRVVGELDQATVEDLKGPLGEAIEGDATALMVDLTDCEFIDSTGLGALLSAREQMRGEGGDARAFGICCPNSQVRRLLEITGIDEAMGLHATREDALAALRA